MLDRMRDLAAGFDAGGESEYATALGLYRHPTRAKVTPEQLRAYDANISALSRQLRMTGEHGRTWKPHQYLALLFTEHYLNRYFSDPESLRADLNEAKRQDSLTKGLPDYTPDDLRTIAFQSATGSGKTLIMHAHILPVPALASPGGQAAQQRHPADPERADVGTARRRAKQERPPRPHLLERRRSGLVPHGRDHRSQQAGGEEGRQARRRAGLRRQQPGAGRRRAPRCVRKRLARTARGAGAGRLRLRIFSHLQPDRGPGRSPPGRLREVPAVRLLLPPVPRGRLRQGLRHREPVGRHSG